MRARACVCVREKEKEREISDELMKLSLRHKLTSPDETQVTTSQTKPESAEQRGLQRRDKQQPAAHGRTAAHSREPVRTKIHSVA